MPRVMIFSGIRMVHADVQHSFFNYSVIKSDYSNSCQIMVINFANVK